MPSHQQAILTFEDDQLDRALENLKRAQRVCYVENARKGAALGPDEMLMRQILYADCELYMALLTFLKQGTVQFVSATISQGPLHMSVVNRAGSVSEISPCHSFLLQKFCWVVHMRSLVGPVTKILVFSTKIFVTGAFLYS